MSTLYVNKAGLIWRHDVSKVIMPWRWS